MALSKKDQVLIAQLQRQAHVNRALRWSPLPTPEPDVLPPIGVSAKSVHGWTFNAYSGVVERQWTSSIYHGALVPREGRYVESYASQKPKALYSTESLALKALRCALERQFAEKLAELDERIERAEAVERSERAEEIVNAETHTHS